MLNMDLGFDEDRVKPSHENVVRTNFIAKVK